MTREQMLEILAEDYGLEVILEQNDIEPSFVLELLVNRRLIDLDDYFYPDGTKIDEL